MFLPRETPLELDPEHLLGLRLSLNTPVVSTEEIPTGPARAALAVHRDAGGRPTVTLAVRSVQAGHAVFYGLEEDLAGDAGLAMGVDAALSFGESLGFLFDDDELTSGDASTDAFALWSSIVGDAELTKVMEITKERRGSAAPPSPDLEPDGEELLLEDLVLDDDPLEELPGLGEPSPEPRAPDHQAPPPSLTKFRAVQASTEGQEPEAGEPPRRALLARVRLIKRAAKLEKPREEEPSPEPDRLLRLLSSF